MLAMQAGKSVYCEKPLCNSIAELRVLAAASQKYKVATMMGIQYHSHEGARATVEMLRSGAIGDVRKCTPGATGPAGLTFRICPRRPRPRGRQLDAWIGPRKYMEYVKGVHPTIGAAGGSSAPGPWATWGPHLDCMYWALEPGIPTKVAVLKSEGISDISFPKATIIKWTSRQGQPSRLCPLLV